MRRSFKKDILPKGPPPKGARQYKRRANYKTQQKRCNDLEILFQDYKAQIGKDFNLKDLAYCTGVNVNTVRRWFYGYCPGHLVHWHVARWFAAQIGIHEQIVYDDIVATIKEFKDGKSTK